MSGTAAGTNAVESTLEPWMGKSLSAEPLAAGGGAASGLRAARGALGAAAGGSVGLGLGVGSSEAGDGDRGRRWHSVQPSRKRVTASLGRNAYVSVI